MMKTLVLATTAAIVISSAAFAADHKPAKMDDAKLDTVAAGAIVGSNLIAVDVSNVANNNQVVVAISVNAAVAANVLGGPAGAVATQPGRILVSRHVFAVPAAKPNLPNRAPR